MKTIKALFQKEKWIRGMLGIAACMMVFCLTGFVSEAAEGKVKAETAKIREEASTDSEVIGSTSKGKTVDIVGAVKDASGVVWYKVPNGNNTYGYIRSDLIETSDEIKITESSASNSSASESTAKPAETVPTAIGEQQATVKESSVRIRSGASTQHDTVASLPQGTVMTLIGEANDSAGNKWYQITCSYNNKTIEGYVRADLITIGEAAEGNEAEGGENAENGETAGAEGENAGEGTAEGTQQPAAAEPEYNDYEVVYNDGEYWLYNNIDSTMMKVTEVLNVVTTSNQNNADMQAQLKTNKIIIVILAVLIVILVVIVTVLLFKLKDLYYEDYYDDEEEEEEEPVVVKKKTRLVQVEEEEEEAPARKKRPVTLDAEERTGKGTSQEKEKAVRQKAEQPELQAAEKKASVKRQTPRKAQNFLLDDDEFEFEFLNMDDKDF